jgi:hypothetical protein
VLVSYLLCGDGLVLSIVYTFDIYQSKSFVSCSCRWREVLEYIRIIFSGIVLVLEEIVLYLICNVNRCVRLL